MTIKVNFSKISKNSKNFRKNVLLTPVESKEKIVVNELKSGEVEFLIPFVIDIKKSITKDVSFEIQITNNQKNMSNSFTDTNANLPDKAIDKLKALPGQRNNKASFMQRIKKRQKIKQLEQGTLRSKSNNDFDVNAGYENRSRLSDTDTTKAIANNNILLLNVLEGHKYKADIVKINSTNKIRKIKLDYTKSISNKSAKKIKRSSTSRRYSNLSLFGTTTKYVLGYPRNPGANLSANILLTHVEADTENSQKLKTASVVGKSSQGLHAKRKNVKNRMQKFYIRGKDPAASFEGIPSHRSVKNIKRGTKPKLGIKSNGKKKNPIKDNRLSESLKTGKISDDLQLLTDVIKNNQMKVREGRGGFGSFELKKIKPPEDFPFVYAEKQVITSKVIYLKYKLRQSEMFGGRVNMKIIGKNSKGLVLISKKFTLHALDLMISQLLVPSSMPTLRVFNTKSKNFAKVTIANRDEKRAISFDLYRKIMSPDKNFKNAHFVKVLSGKVKPNSDFTEKIRQMSTAQCMYRMVFSVSNSFGTVQYANYVDDFTLSKDRNRTSRSINMFASVDQDQKCINVELNNISPDVATVKLLKRTIGDSIAPTRFKKMNIVLDKNNEKELEVNLQGDDDVASFKDYHVFDDRSYEYQALMILENGTKIKSNERAAEKYYDKEGTVDVVLVDKVLDKFRQIFSGKIVFAKESNIVDKTLETLHDSAGDGVQIFQNEISKIKSLAKSTFRAHVTLHNLTTGHVHFIGDVGNNENFKTPKIKKDSRFVIKIEPYEFTPTFVAEKIQRTLLKAENLKPGEVITKFSQARLSALSSGLPSTSKKSSRTIKKHRSKFFNKRAMKRGTIPPADLSKSRSKSISKKDIIQIEYLGDTKYFYFDTFSSKIFNAAPKSINITPDHNVVVNFSITGVVNQVDFYIITCRKENSEFPIGSAHCIKEDREVTFLDYINHDYLGVIDYFVQAVFEDGDMSEKFYIGRATLINKFDNFRLLSK